MSEIPKLVIKPRDTDELERRAKDRLASFRDGLRRLDRLDIVKVREESASKGSYRRHCQAELQKELASAPAPSFSDEDAE